MNIIAEKIKSRDDWYDMREDLLEGEIYEFHLENGFVPKLRKQSGTTYVDFRMNEYMIDYRDDNLMLYKKQDESNELEKLSEIKKIKL